MENTLKTANENNNNAANNAVPSSIISAMLAAHPTPSTEGKTAAEYTYEALKMHEEQYQGQGTKPPALLKWAGDASLAFAPKNRMYSAIGLTSGLIVGGNLANIALGRKLLDGSEVKAGDVPTFLQKIHKVIKNYDPKVTDSRNKWLKYAHWSVYSLGGLLGIKIGTDLAYKEAKEAAKNPRYLEDFLTSVSHTQGETWSWLSSFSGIFGSASGTWAVPVPGLNYAVGMIGRITSMQDRNTMISGLNELTSGAVTPSYLRLKEGMHYLSHYAVGNPARDATQIEFLAYSLLGPVFRDKLTAEHIKQFTEVVNEVRDHYWQEGGIPKEKREEALHTMKEVFTGAGLEVLLINMGLNPASIAFDDRNGLIGKIGNIGHKGELKAKQEAFWSALEERLPKYVEGDVITKERAEWVKHSIAEMRKGSKDSYQKFMVYEPSAGDKYQKPESSFAEKSDKKQAPDVDIEDSIAARPSLGIKRQENSIEKLLKSAKEQGDWRETILKQRQQMDSPRLVVE